MALLPSTQKPALGGWKDRCWVCATPLAQLPRAAAFGGFAPFLGGCVHASIFQLAALGNAEVQQDAKQSRTEPGGNSWGEGMWIFWDRLSRAPPSHPLPHGEPPAHLHPALSWEGAGEQCRMNPGGSCCWKLLEKAQLQQWQQQLDTAAPTGTPSHPRASTEKPPALKQSHTHSTSHTRGPLRGGDKRPRQ